MLTLHGAVERLAGWRRRCVKVIVALSFAMAYSLTWPSPGDGAATRTILVAWLAAVLGWLISAAREASREKRLDHLARSSHNRFIRVPDRFQPTSDDGR